MAEKEGRSTTQCPKVQGFERQRREFFAGWSSVPEVLVSHRYTGGLIEAPDGYLQREQCNITRYACGLQLLPSQVKANRAFGIKCWKPKQQKYH